MIEKEFENYLDNEYFPIVNQLTKKLPLAPIITLVLIVSLLYHHTLQHVGVVASTKD
jgi:hypothetical protein